MKRYFHEELEDVRSHLMLMGEKAIANVNLAMRALEESDLGITQEVKDADDRIDEIEKSIDEEVARYIGLRAPVARDLRLLFVAIKASNDLERVGDEAVSIAKRTRKILQTGRKVEDLGTLPKMCEIAVSMLKTALRCFIDEDADKAVSVFKQDKEVDRLNRENFQQYMEDMRCDPNFVQAGTEIIFISKSMERIADHAQNIAEEVYFLLTTRDLKEVVKQGKSD